MSQLESLFTSSIEPGDGILTYSSLAPLYDFIYSKHYDYSVQEEVIQTHMPSETSALAEGGCGTGRLLQRFDDEFETVVGIDESEDMLDIAAERTSATLVNKSLNEYTCANEFDVYAVLGGVFFHIRSTARLESIFETIYTNLNENGRLIFDYFSNDSLSDGDTMVQEFESEQFTVERTSISTVQDRKTATISFGYEITDKDSNKTMTVGDCIHGRCYSKKQMENLVSSAGFTIQEHFQHESDSLETTVVCEVEK